MSQQQRFDPWDLIAVPVWWALMGAYTVRDFISDRRKSKS